VTDPRAQADESVAASFSRIMNATTSPAGVLTDPPIVALASAVFFIAFLAALRMDAGTVVPVLGALAATPLAIAIVTSLGLIGARRKVVAWLGGLPFPIENMNALLNGLGDGLEVTFTGARPESAALNAALDRVHPDCFVTRNEAGEHTVEIRIGVVESKRNPARSNHQRYVRVKAIVEQVLVPASKEHAVAGVIVK
jgi:hypothetical protein